MNKYLLAFSFIALSAWAGDALLTFKESKIPLDYFKDKNFDWDLLESKDGSFKYGVVSDKKSRILEEYEEKKRFELNPGDLGDAYVYFQDGVLKSYLSKEDKWALKDTHPELFEQTSPNWKNIKPLVLKKGSNLNGFEVFDDTSRKDFCWIILHARFAGEDKNNLSLKGRFSLSPSKHIFSSEGFFGRPSAEYEWGTHNFFGPLPDSTPTNVYCKLYQDKNKEDGQTFLRHGTDISHLQKHFGSYLESSRIIVRQTTEKTVDEPDLAGEHSK
jgi:hypothetical protein